MCSAHLSRPRLYRARKQIKALRAAKMIVARPTVRLRVSTTRQREPETRRMTCDLDPQKQRRDAHRGTRCRYSTGSCRAIYHHRVCDAQSYNVLRDIDGYNPSGQAGLHHAVCLGTLLRSYEFGNSRRNGVHMRRFDLCDISHIFDACQRHDADPCRTYHVGLLCWRADIWMFADSVRIGCQFAGGAALPHASLWFI